MDMTTFLTTKVKPKIEEILEQSIELEFGEVRISDQAGQRGAKGSIAKKLHS